MVATRKLAWVALIAVILVSAGIAYGAYVLAGYSWDQVVSYQTPFGDYKRPWVGTMSDSAQQSAEETQAPRVALVIVDGLGADAAADMGALSTLRGYGSDMVAITPQPSLSYPTWTTILTGAPPDISGVTTNWFDGAIPVESILDVALAQGMQTVVVGPDSFETLYLDGWMGRKNLGTYFEPWSDDHYMSSGYVDEAIALAEEYEPSLLVLHLPDIDEIAHQHGKDSDEFRDVVSRVDSDISRFVESLQDDRTTFVITADHGHIPPGGHGGWESEVTRVSALFVGRGVASQRNAEMKQVDIAPTVVGLLGLPVPRHAAGQVREDILLGDSAAITAGEAHYRVFAENYLALTNGETYELGGARTYDDVTAVVTAAQDERLATDRAARLPEAAVLALFALAALATIGLFSWRALVAALSGVVTYYLVYNGLYFIVHGHQWSLSAFNTEDLVEAFFNLRMIEAAVAGLIAVVVAGVVYPLLRNRPKGPRRTYLAGWLTLGPATVLAIQATIGIQVAWFFWAWGADVTWRLPDLKWGFKYDLDLIQMAALGAVALLAPLATYLVGRYHPRVRRAEAERIAAAETN